MSALAIIALIVYVLGLPVFLYVLIPKLIEGGIGAWIYRACILGPGNWPLGLPFVAIAFAITLTWPAVLAIWLIAGRPRPPLICTEALVERYSYSPTNWVPILTLVPSGIPKRLSEFETDMPTAFGSAAEFWAFYTNGR